MSIRRPAPANPATSEPPQAPPLPRGRDAGARRSLRESLLRSLPGWLFVTSLAIKALVAAVQPEAPLSGPLRVLSGAATAGLLVALVCFAWRLVVRAQRRLLWRVRRKLIISYVFIGFVPTLLVVAFFLFAGSLMFMNVSAYLFKDAFDDLVTDVRWIARDVRAELDRSGVDAEQVLTRAVARGRTRYADLGIAAVPVDLAESLAPGQRELSEQEGSAPELRVVSPAGGAAARPAFRAGPWWHGDPPASIPAWLKADGFAGALAMAPADAPDEIMLDIRVVLPPARPGPGYAVVVDLPVTPEVIERLYDNTGVRAGGISALAEGVATQAARPRGAGDAATEPADNEAGGSTVVVSPLSFRHSVAFLDIVDWSSGRTESAGVGLNVELGELYARISSEQAVVSGNVTLGQAFLFVLALVASMFLVIQFVAFVMGFTLARSITRSIHELFTGTQRVRQGDLTHRINIRSRDQLGELAGSFNEMTSSIGDLLQQVAEKKRLEEELRIAREIQMSLLPPGPLHMRGLSMSALCVPAREVGGDYYDYFRLSERSVGVLIADVAGKGTSAALYMAELRGLFLSLSQTWRSPRELLIEANRLLADNLNTRAFITMTYAVLDLDARRMTYVRAGHTPMIYVPGRGGGAQVLVPNGMVVGLRVPGAEEKFSELLEEVTLPLEEGDVFALYTDGITEAVNPESAFFGEARLGDIVEGHHHLEPAELRERILREVLAFGEGADQHDDMTIVLLKIDPAAVGAVAAVGAL